MHLHLPRYGTWRLAARDQAGPERWAEYSRNYCSREAYGARGVDRSLGRKTREKDDQKGEGGARDGGPCDRRKHSP